MHADSFHSGRGQARVAQQLLHTIGIEMRQLIRYQRLAFDFVLAGGLQRHQRFAQGRRKRNIRCMQRAIECGDDTIDAVEAGAGH